MKKSLLFVFAMLMGIATIEAQTVVFEDGFESYDNGYNLVGAGYAVWEGSATVTDVTTEGAVGTANSGNKFGKSDMSKNNFAFRRTFTLEVGKTYTWSIATKVQDGVGYTLQVNPVATYQKIDLNNVVWETHSAQFTVQEGAETVTLAVYRWAKKVVSFDDFKLVENISAGISSIGKEDVEIFQSASGSFTITGSVEISSVKVFALSGQLIKQVVNTGSSKVNLELNEVPQGIYILRVQDKQGSVSVKKVVKN